MPAAIPGRRSTQVRINEQIYEKVRVIARLENRNINSQIEYFVTQSVLAYEAEHGKIHVDESASDN